MTRFVRRLIPFGFFVLAAPAFGLVGVACGAGGTDFDARYAPGYVPGTRASVSLIGVYRDGRLNPDMWDELAPSLSPWLGKDRCDIVYSAELLTAHEELAGAIDDVTRSDGVTDELLGAVAPMAEGDAIVLVTMDGKIAAGDASTPYEPPTAGPTYNGRAMGRRGAGGGTIRGASGSFRNPGVLEMSASVYSRKDKATVARVDMKYTGNSADDAKKKFVEKLRAALPGLTCVGWKLDQPVSPDAVRAVRE